VIFLIYCAELSNRPEFENFFYWQIGNSDLTETLCCGSYLPAGRQVHFNRNPHYHPTFPEFARKSFRNLIYPSDFPFITHCYPLILDLIFKNIGAGGLGGSFLVSSFLPIVTHFLRLIELWCVFDFVADMLNGLKDYNTNYYANRQIIVL